MSTSLPFACTSAAVVTVGALLTACTPHTTPMRQDTPTMEQRVSELEQRLERLEARPKVLAPYRSRVELEAAIQLLQAERIRLLNRYTEQHPEIRDLDRRLAILDRQMKMLAQP